MYKYLEEDMYTKIFLKTIVGFRYSEPGAMGDADMTSL